LNYAGIKPDLVNYVCDLAKSKQGKFMPGSHIPIYAPEQVDWTELDVVLVLPWNIASEVKTQLSANLKPGALFATAVPCLKIDI